LLNTPRPSAYTAQQIGNPPLRIRLSLATSLQRPATPVQKATHELIRSKAPGVIAHAL
jgi:LysR family nitrogen assimilation transcriptional regulator